MAFGYQDKSIPERAHLHQDEIEQEAAKRELVGEAARDRDDGGAKPQSAVTRLLARFRGRNG
jgi:hypothetical protein